MRTKEDTSANIDAECDRIAAVIERIAFDEHGNRKDQDDTAPAIIAALEGKSHIFWALDEMPGKYNGYRPGGYHSALRVIRNSPKWGPKLFASFKN